MMDNEIRISWSFHISFLLNIRLRFMLAALHACFCFFLFGFQTNGLLNHERQYVQKKYFEDNTEADFTKNKQLQNNILLLSFICVFHSGYKKHLPSNTFVKSFTFVFWNIYNHGLLKAIFLPFRHISASPQRNSEVHNCTSINFFLLCYKHICGCFQDFL